MLHTPELLTQLGVEQNAWQTDPEINPRLQRDPHLRVDGEELSLAEVVGAVVDLVVVEVVLVHQRHVVVLVVQRTGDVEFLVDYLTTQSQSDTSIFSQPETRSAVLFCF